MTVHKLNQDINKMLVRFICLCAASLLFFTTPVYASVEDDFYDFDDIFLEDSEFWDAIQEDSEFSEAIQEDSNESPAIIQENGSTYSLIIYDEADYFSPEQETQLKDLMTEITEFGNVALVTTESLSSSYSSTENFAVGYYEDWFSPGANGVIFVIDRYYNEIYLCSEGAARKTISNGRASTITDNTYTYATEAGGRDYFTCAYKSLEQVLTLMQGGRIAQPMRYICSALLAIILALLFNYFIVRFASRSRKADMNKILEGTYANVTLHNAHATFINQTRTYSPQSSGGGGGHGGGGGGGGGHSGGGHSI